MVRVRKSPDTVASPRRVRKLLLHPVKWDKLPAV